MLDHSPTCLVHGAENDGKPFGFCRLLQVSRKATALGGDCHRGLVYGRLIHFFEVYGKCEPYTPVVREVTGLTYHEARSRAGAMVGMPSSSNGDIQVVLVDISNARQYVCFVFRVHNDSLM